MTILDHLITFQSDFRSCETIAYADLSSKMILCSTSLVKMRQEQLDALCASASDFLNGPATSAAQSNLMSDPQAKVDNVLVVSGEALHIFVRSPKDDDEAICCICSPETDPIKFSAAAQDVLVALEASA